MECIMRKSEYKYIRDLVVAAKNKYFLGKNDEGEIYLSAIERYCETMVDDIQMQEDNERWLEEKRIEASIGTSNQ